MKADELFDAIGSVDESLISDVRTKQKSTIKRARLTALLAATLACILVIGSAFAFAMFAENGNDNSNKNEDAENKDNSGVTPPLDSDLSKYSSSEYFAIIEKLAEFYDSKKNNDSDDVINYPSSDESTDSDEDGFDLDGYVEVTDNQEANVVEGDLLKRSEKYAFYLHDGVLNAYSIGSGSTEPVFSINVMSVSSHYLHDCELYLSEDLSTVTVFVAYLDKNAGKRQAVDVISLDVSDPQNVTQKEKLTFWGSDVETRRINGNFIISYDYKINNRPDYSVEFDYVPQINVGEGADSIDFDSIIIPEEVIYENYVVYMKIGESDLEVKDSLAMLSADGFNYVSENRIFLVNNYSSRKVESGYLISTRKSTISCISIASDDLELIGKIEIDGHPIDRFCLDDHGGYLRVITATSTGKAKIAGEVQDDIDEDMFGLNANLYCIDLGDMSIASSVIKFAPTGETVRSVRFSDTAAYVCTSIMLTDPVFFFDLTDINNITYKHTGEIPGFSTSLIDIGDGYLLGVGISDRGTFKLETYKEGNESVEPIDSCVLDFLYYPTDYKSYLIDRDNRLFGISLADPLNSNLDGYITNCYVVFSINNGIIDEVTRVEIPDSVGNTKLKLTRAFVDDGNLYLFRGYELQDKVLTIMPLYE